MIPPRPDAPLTDDVPEQSENNKERNIISRTLPGHYQDKFTFTRTKCSSTIKIVFNKYSFFTVFHIIIAFFSHPVLFQDIFWFVKIQDISRLGK